MAASGLPRMQAGLGASPLVVRLPNFRTRRRTASLWKLQRGRMATSGLLSFMATKLGALPLLARLPNFRPRRGAILKELQRGRMATSGLPRMWVARLGALPLLVRLPSLRFQILLVVLWELRRDRVAISVLPRREQTKLDTSYPGRNRSLSVC